MTIEERKDSCAISRTVPDFLTYYDPFLEAAICWLVTAWPRWVGLLSHRRPLSTIRGREEAELGWHNAKDTHWGWERIIIFSSTHSDKS